MGDEFPKHSKIIFRRSLHTLTQSQQDSVEKLLNCSWMIVFGGVVINQLHRVLST
jgi:hypothetical protein